MDDGKDGDSKKQSTAKDDIIVETEEEGKQNEDKSNPEKDEDE